MAAYMQCLCSVSPPAAAWSMLSLYSSSSHSLAAELGHSLSCRLLGPSSLSVVRSFSPSHCWQSDKASSAAAARTQLNYNARPGQRHPELRNTSVILQRDTLHDRDSAADFLRNAKIDPVLSKGIMMQEECSSRSDSGRAVGTQCD